MAGVDRRHRDQRLVHGEAAGRTEVRAEGADAPARRVRIADQLGPGAVRRDPHHWRGRGVDGGYLRRLHRTGERRRGVQGIAIFIEGWIAERIAPTYDAELEKTHAYALFLLLIPGLLLLFFNLVPFFKRGTEFQVRPDGSVTVRQGDSWEPLIEYQYSTVTADGTTIEFTPPPDGPPAIVLPQDRVFSREYGARLPAKVSAEFFRRLLAGRGFDVESAPSSSSFTAQRK